MDVAILHPSDLQKLDWKLKRGTIAQVVGLGIIHEAMKTSHYLMDIPIS